MKAAKLTKKATSECSADMSGNPVLKELGKSLERHRQAAGKTQVDLAYDAEVERSRISKIECGRVNPTLLTLATLCYSLDITLAKLFEGVTATMLPIFQGGTPRRANQATLEPDQRLAKRKS